MLVFDTICALATAPYKSALAIIRLSGPKTRDVLSHVIKKDTDKLEPNHAYFFHLYEDKDHPFKVIDEAVVVFYEGPKSYTGFDMAEFYIHGSLLIADELLDALVKWGARRAMKGEFSAQSYYNGKMDLLKAEGINDLINATSKRAKTIATDTLSGKNSEIVLDLKKKLLDYLSELEYYVEDQYSQEKDDYDEELLKVKKSLDKDILDLDKIIDKTKRANREYQGFNIAIAGEPNVGKSTLLNAILGEDKAIVSPIPGTTRDVVEGEKEINGLLFRFKDTAGLRKTSDFVENLGIERSYKTVKDADLVLLTSDCGFEDIYKDEELKSVLKDKKIIKVATKRDINTHIADADISICSLKDDISALTDKILSALSLDKKEESAFLGKREEEYLGKISSQMKKASEAISETGQIDISSDTLRVAVAFINELIGNSEGQTMEDIYQTLFSKFCLGK